MDNGIANTSQGARKLVRTLKLTKINRYRYISKITLILLHSYRLDSFFSLMTTYIGGISIPIRDETN